LQKRINFTINVPFEMKKANIVLPPGNYVLFQINTTDPHLFGLYRDDLTHSPIAMIRTVRIDNSTRWPQKTKMLMDIDESSVQNYAVLEGWNVPGEDGFEVISVVSRRGPVVARYQARSTIRSRRSY
jgi:hypothetical protein